MSTFRDLRDLINVSRLTYRDSDDDESNESNLNQYNFENITPRVSGGVESNYSSISSSSRTSISGGSAGYNKYDPVSKKLNPNNRAVPNISYSMPVQKLKQSNSPSSMILSSNNENRGSILLDRNSKLSISFSKYRKPLPPLNSNKDKEDKSDFDQEPDEEEMKIDNTPNTRSSLMRKKLLKIENLDEIESINKEENDPLNKREGNFDDLLTYIDASVVSEWLNRANRSLKKMSTWHRDNNRIFNDSNNNKNNFLNYESFIQFANFWLGYSNTANLSEKQRRSLIEMEYSIICDEVMQAFQVGLDSQQISVRDVHELLKAVFKEYPLQLLSFRGPYLILDFIDILSSDRQNDYKNLLSDVKCRTINKQYAQWLLSIRSFALINMCYSIIKFYKKTVESDFVNQSINLMKNGDSMLNELDGRLSSLSITMNNENMKKDSNLNMSSSSSSSSISSSRSSTASLSSTNTVNSANKRLIKSAIKNSEDKKFSFISNQLKYDFYKKAVFK
jgi:hypothetical protein